MVLTNFECWAHGGSSDGPMFVDAVIERRNPATVDLFNPNALQEYSEQSENNPPKIVSHLSSNGYYGFAPICRAVTGNGAATSPNSSDDVKIIQQQQQQQQRSGEILQMMDVEQHSTSNNSGCILNSPPQTDVAIAENVDTTFRNGSTVRRKRFLAEDDFFQTQRRNAKRCRFDGQREQYLRDNNNGCCPSTYAPTALFSLSMDHDELPIVTISNSTNDVHPAVSCGNSSFSSINQRLAVNSSSSDDLTNRKSNFSCNNSSKYNDISRCMLSHML